MSSIRYLKESKLKQKLQKGILAVLPEAKQNQYRMNVLEKSLILASEERFLVDTNIFANWQVSMILLI